MMMIEPGLYDDRYLPLDYTGLWTNVLSSEAYNGAYSSSTTGTLEFSFSGSGVAVYGVQSASGGNGEICINLDCYAISFYTPGVDVHQVEIISITGLDGGLSHDVTITADGGGDVMVDAIYIAPAGPPPTPTPEPEATPEPLPAWETRYDLGSGQGITEYRITSGDIGIMLFVAVSAMLSFAGLLLQLNRGN